MKKTKKSTQSTQQKFSDIEDDLDNINEIEKEECVDCSKLSVINVTLLPKDKDVVDSKAKLNDKSSSTTNTCDFQNKNVVAEDITKNESDSDDDSCEKEISRIVESQLYNDTEEYSKIMKKN